MGILAAKPRSAMRPIYKIRLNITLKKVAQHWKRHGLAQKSKNELLDGSRGPLIRVEDDHNNNPWKCVAKNAQVINIDHMGRAKIKFGFPRKGDCIRQFVHQIICFSTLTELTIIFPLELHRQHYTEFIITKISRHLTQLRKLNLNFTSNIQVDEKTFRIIGFEIARHLVNLEELGVMGIGAEASSIYDRINNFLHPINKYMNKLTCLKWLFDDFDDNKTLEALGDNLDRCLAGLRHLEIFLCGCWTIDNEGFEVLSSQVGKHLVNLQSLTFRVIKSKFEKKRILEMFRTKSPHLPSNHIKVFTDPDKYWERFIL